MPYNPDKVDYSGGLPKGFQSFQVIEDKRSPGFTQHHFGAVLFLCVTGILCGMNGFASIEHFGNLHRKWFRKWVELPNGIPRAQTLSNIFQLIDPAQFQRCLGEHLRALHPDLQAQVVAVDGKNLRGTNQFLEEAAHTVSAWAADSGLTLAQEFVSEKSNEITALPKLLEMLDLEGHIVTIDAMGTQTAIAGQIVDQKADYVLALKGNQGNTRKEVGDHFDFALRQLDLKTAKGWSHHQQKPEKSHGRLTTRTVLSTSNLASLDDDIRKRWPGLQSLIVVESETEIPSTGEKRDKERRYYLSSLVATAGEFHEIIRKHWAIENQCHWVLDVVFREDGNHIHRKNAPLNFSCLVRIALNLLKEDTSLKGSLPKKRREAAFNESYREKLLFSRA
jgi:predicted transposase YbfD/YdcC